MINVKRLMSIGAVVVVIGALSLFSTGALAAAGPAEETGAQYGAAGEAFIDEDGDGVCDNVGTSTGNAYAYAYGYGDSRGTGECNGTGENFVDADGDGVCDNVGTGTGSANSYGGGARMGSNGQRGTGVCLAG